MKKSKFSVELNREFFERSVRAFTRNGRWLLTSGFLSFHRVFERLIMLTIFLIAVAIILKLTFYTPPEPLGPPTLQSELQADEIDTLEFWLEEREAERAKGIPVRSDVW